jgi:hypothetical protein
MYFIPEQEIEIKGFCSLVFFISDSPFRKYIHNENLIQSLRDWNRRCIFRDIDFCRRNALHCLRGFVPELYLKMFSENLDRQIGACKCSSVGRKINLQCMYFRVLYIRF